jgi:hypothetical protein
MRAGHIRDPYGSVTRAGQADDAELYLIIGICLNRAPVIRRLLVLGAPGEHDRRCIALTKPV